MSDPVIQRTTMDMFATGRPVAVARICAFALIVSACSYDTDALRGTAYSNGTDAGDDARNAMDTNADTTLFLPPVDASPRDTASTGGTAGTSGVAGMGGTPGMASAPGGTGGIVGAGGTSGTGGMGAAGGAGCKPEPIWVNRTPDPLPRAWPRLRWVSAMAWDGVRGRVILFGGHWGAASLNDMWEWDGRTWAEIPQAGSWPRTRLGHAMVWDSKRNVIVLFGGSGDGYLDDLWEWNGSSWASVARSGPWPPPRRAHAMAFDAARGRVVIFGGEASSNLDDLWEWDGQRWHNMTLATLPDNWPTARSNHAMAYDETSRKVVVFGGDRGGQTLNDMIAWDGSNWTTVMANVPWPNARSGHAIVATTRGLFLYGGENLGDAWTFTGGTWSPMQMRAPWPPQPVHYHSMAFDPLRCEVVLFGGERSRNIETWVWGSRE